MSATHEVLCAKSVAKEPDFVLCTCGTTGLWVRRESPSGVTIRRGNKILVSVLGDELDHLIQQLTDSYDDARWREGIS